MKAKAMETDQGGYSMAEATPRLYVPALGGLYTATRDFAEPILRIALGAVLIPHGCQKLFGLFGGMGYTANAALFERLGYAPGGFWGTLVGLTEFVGGILLVIGLFTRFAAAAVLIFMLTAIHFTSAKGFFWSAGGMEYPILIGVCALYFVIRGGGPYSLDHQVLRREL
jgi:putative oxidoreductase